MAESCPLTHCYCSYLLSILLIIIMSRCHLIDLSCSPICRINVLLSLVVRSSGEESLDDLDADRHDETNSLRPHIAL